MSGKERKAEEPRGGERRFRINPEVASRLGIDPEMDLAVPDNWETMGSEAKVRWAVEQVPKAVKESLLAAGFTPEVAGAVVDMAARATGKTPRAMAGALLIDHINSPREAMWALGLTNYLGYRHGMGDKEHPTQEQYNDLSHREVTAHTDAAMAVAELVLMNPEHWRGLLTPLRSKGED